MEFLEIEFAMRVAWRMKMEIDIMMVSATISALRCGRYKGVEDYGLLEDWEEKFKEESND